MDYSSILEEHGLCGDETFRHMILDRLRTDCSYYLGCGGRSPKVLWAHDEKLQIKLMRALHDSFPIDKKPQWLSIKDIDEYERLMLSRV